MVLEVVILTLVVFIVAPILFVRFHSLALSILLLTYRTAILEHLPHVSWPSPTAESWHDQA